MAEKIRSGISLLRPTGLAGVAVVLLCGTSADAQSRSNPYSPSPGNQAASAVQKRQSGPDGTIAFRLTPDSAAGTPVDEPTPIAQAAAKPPPAKLHSPSEIYRIGIGDVLLVTLRNAANGSGYFTVRTDGTIDYPLAGDHVAVAGDTVYAVKEKIAAGIKLFGSPEVDVKVRQYASHKITVSGMVENPGEKYLQREAMPLFAIRAEAGPDANASKVRIRRAASDDLLLDLRDPKIGETLIFPGDHVHFTGDAAGSLGAYFISGEIASGGQKALTEGMTLYQAIAAAGGAKGDPKKAVIRRRNEKGVLAAFEHNLRSIRNGKAMDPALAPGDIIEVKN